MGGGFVSETLFRDVAERSIKLESAKSRTVWVSIVVHAAVAGALVLVPILAPAVLPMPTTMLAFAAPLPAALPDVPQPQPNTFRGPRRNLTPTTTHVVVPLQAPSSMRSETSDL